MRNGRNERNEKETTLQSNNRKFVWLYWYCMFYSYVYCVRNVWEIQLNSYWMKKMWLIRDIIGMK